MPRIDPVPRDELPDDLATVGRDPFCAVLAHRPDLLRAWHRLDLALVEEGNLLPTSLKENARRAMAQQTGCRYCATLGGAPDLGDRPSIRESLADTFATMMGEDHRAIDDGVLHAMREEFSEAELVELITFLAFKLAGQVIGSVVGLEPATERQQAGYAAFLGLRDGTSTGAGTSPKPTTA